MRLAELIQEAGLPEGVLQVVNGDKEAVDAILDNETIQAVGFVGSTPIAQYIYGRAAANGKRAQCFGGAKNHMIIMPDADMDKAADALVGAGFGAAGERCMAISVAVPVGEDTADALIERLVPQIEKLKVGPYTAGEDVDFGPVITEASQDRIAGLIDSGVDAGCRACRRRTRLQAPGLRERLLRRPVAISTTSRRTWTSTRKRSSARC